MSFKPDHSPRTVALIGKFQSRDIAESLDLLAQALCARDIKVLIEADTAQHIGQQLTSFPWEEADYTRIGKTAELAIVIGGDGTFLAAARNLASYQVPLVGVNQGRLGFMTDIARADMIDCLDDLLAGRFIPGRRLLLEGEVLRNGTPLFPKSNFAVNDIVVDKGAIGRLIELELLINGEFIYNLRADGLIIATPTGSTAYALSAGGPILQPDLEGIAIVPLYPHALSNRPLIVPARGEIEIRIVQAEDARVYFDGQLTIDAHRGDSIKIHRASDGFYLLHPPGYSYFSMLRQKLHWSARPHG